jgi:hypothetical protein
MPSNQDAYQALGKLYDALDKAYWAASTVEAKDRIYGLSSIVIDAYNDMAAQNLAADTSQYQGASDALKCITDKLSDLKNDIATLVHAIGIANDVVSAINSVLPILV